MKTAPHTMNLLSAAICIAMNTGDHNETDHAVSVLNMSYPQDGFRRMNAMETAARVLAEEYEKRDGLCCALMRQNDFLANANRDLMEKHEMDERLLVHRTEEVRWLEAKNKRLRDALAEIEASSFGWKEEVARRALDVSNDEKTAGT
jgi:hypothetical protein